MSYCIIKHNYIGKDELSGSNMYTIYSKFETILEHVNPKPSLSSVFCHIPNIRIIPKWDEFISNYAGDGDTLEVEIYPIEYDVIKIFRNKYSTTKLPEIISKFISNNEKNDKMEEKKENNNAS